MDSKEAGTTMPNDQYRTLAAYCLQRGKCEALQPRPVLYPTRWASANLEALGTRLLPARPLGPCFCPYHPAQPLCMYELSIPTYGVVAGVLRAGVRARLSSICM